MAPEFDSEPASMARKEQALLCSRSEPEVSLLQWHPTRRNRRGTPDGMSLERSMSRRNRLGTPGGMSLERSME